MRVTDFTWYEAIEEGKGKYTIAARVTLDPKALYTFAYDWREVDGVLRLVRIGLRGESPDSNFVTPVVEAPEGNPLHIEEDKRLSFDQIWLEVAKTVAKRGTCPRLKVGAVIVDSSNQIISTGFNGAPRGLAHCTEVGCLIDDSGRCKRTAHAEANALIQAGRSRTYGGTLYSTHFPCSECANLIIQAGIYRLVYITPYDSQPDIAAEIYEMFKEAGIFAERMLPRD
jgi:dCMP deaminase